MRDFSIPGGVLARCLAVSTALAGFADAALAQSRPVPATQMAVPGFEKSLCEGEISTFPLGAIPAGTMYDVDIFDETEEALAFRDVFLEALRASGRQTGPGARMEFSFESESDYLGLVPQGSIDKQRRAAELDRDPGAEVGVTELRDTIRESRGGDRAPATGLAQQLDAKAELRDTQSGKVVWLATLNCRPLTGDRQRLAKYISTVVVESIGQSSGKMAF